MHSTLPFNDHIRQEPQEFDPAESSGSTLLRTVATTLVILAVVIGKYYFIHQQMGISPDPSHFRNSSSHLKSFPTHKG
jgi:predicted secreted protein